MHFKLLPVNIHELNLNNLTANVHFYQGEDLKLDQFDVVILNNDPEQGKHLRKELYALQLSTHQNLQILDLGDGFALNDNELSTLLIQCIEASCYPIILGFNESLAIEISKIWDRQYTPHNLCWINSAYNSTLYDQLSNHLFLKQQYALCLQRQMSGIDFFHIDESQLHLSYLSEFRKSNQSIESFTRNSELFFFNLESVRHSDFPSSSNPSGLFSEEIISLAKLSGSSDRSLISIISTWKSNDKTSLMLISQMIWYTLEGYILKLKDKLGHGKNLSHYVVELKNTDHHLDFYKSENSGKWWIQEPTVDETIQGKLIPCTYEEYLKTVHENLPDRLMQLISQ